MTNFVISIGNTDGKLSQKDWHSFVMLTDNYIRISAEKIHFFGGPENFSPYQNVSWIGEIDGDDVLWLNLKLKDVKELYRQESIFVMYGEGEFL